MEVWERCGRNRRLVVFGELLGASVHSRARLVGAVASRLGGAAAHVRLYTTVLHPEECWRIVRLELLEDRLAKRLLLLDGPQPRPSYSLPQSKRAWTTRQTTTPP